jgi:hypothetical protein
MQRRAPFSAAGPASAALSLSAHHAGKYKLFSGFANGCFIIGQENRRPG